MHAQTIPNNRRLPRRPGRHNFGRRATNPPSVIADCRRRSSAAKADTTGLRILGILARAASAVPDRSTPPASGHTVDQEILRGAAIGLVACLALAWLSGGSYLSFHIALFWGSCVGALIGLLLWVGSPDAPEDPVVPPSPGQARGRESRKLRGRSRQRR